MSESTPTRKTLIQPYLFFGGRCEEAIEFYSNLRGGATVEMLMFHKDSPDPHPPGTRQPGFENKVTHATIHIGDAVLMASDGCDDKSRFDGLRLFLALATDDEVKRAFAGLSEGGCRCRGPRSSGLRASEWSRTDLASVGWSP